MSRKKRKHRHDLLTEDVICRICRGDSCALGILIAQKMNYVRTVIRNTATRFDLEPDDSTVDDLAQIVWVKFITTRLPLLKDFK